MTATILLPDDFQRFINEMKTIVRDELDIRKLASEKPMCLKEAADYLLIHEGTLLRRIKNGKIPANLVHRVDGSVYFLPSELLQFIKKS